MLSSGVPRGHRKCVAAEPLVEELILPFDDEFGQRSESVSIRRFRNAIQRTPCQVREMLRLASGSLQNIVALDQFQNLFKLDGVKPTILQHTGNLLSFFRTALRQKIDQRQRNLAFSEIAANGLAQRFFRRSEIQQVIGTRKASAATWRASAPTPGSSWS